MASVGAAAVLAGLIFIAVSINLEKILSVPGLPGRAGESLVMFLGAMVLGLFVLVPQSERAFAVEILVGVSRTPQCCCSSRSRGHGRPDASRVPGGSRGS